MRKKLNNILALSGLGGMTLLLSGCPSFSLVSPSFTYTNNYSDSNPNAISCYVGTWYSSGYCSIPISRFAAISSDYINPALTNLLLEYTYKYNRFVFTDLDEESSLIQMNELFLANYPTSAQMVLLPEDLQHLYIQIKEVYIPKKDYHQLSTAYTYLYTLSAMQFATAACKEHFESATTPQEALRQTQFMEYKAFSMQYTNAVLLHISDSVDGKYKNEFDLYEHLYEAILDLNPYQLTNMAANLYETTLIYSPDKFESALYTSGVTFGELGKFSCNNITTRWTRFGFEYFGNNIAGTRRLVSFKSKDVLSTYDDDAIPLRLSAESAFVTKP
jgi:hypothetical protein